LVLISLRTNYGPMGPTKSLWALRKFQLVLNWPDRLQVVHMRMHEDVRPFSCSLCDQTFRQKAHLQRHETTHGLGSKVHRSPGTQNASGGFSNPKRKRKRSRGGAGNPTSSVVVVTSAGNVGTGLGGNIIPDSVNRGDDDDMDDDDGVESDSRDGEEVNRVRSLLFDVLTTVDGWCDVLTIVDGWCML